ncbi:MAG: anti-sigma factor antagonist [Clostridia bacterium]|nr:anti-sigma factor antagonist [Clostridia bacterium]
MDNLSFENNKDGLILKLSGHIDSSNAPAIEEEIGKIRANCKAKAVQIDCEKLEYISSAGLRVILRIKKEVPDTKIINVSSEIYDIFNMTGFTEMMEIEKAFRVLSVDQCEVIGQGANGKVYRIDQDTIVKEYFNADALPEINRERELARTAFVLGIPTAIPYDVVRLQNGDYGSVFELLNAKSFAKLLISHEKTLDELVEMSIELLRQIHSTKVKPDTMPDMRATALDWADFLKDYLEPAQYKKLHDLIEEVPKDNHMLHGDYHLKNVMYQNGETLLIDMDTLSHGHPIFELASMYNAYKGFADLNHDNVESFLGIPYDTAVEFWNKSLSLYLKGKDEKTVRQTEEKAMLIGHARIMRRSIRRNGFDTPEGRAVIENSRKHLAELLPRIDTLVF